MKTGLELLVRELSDARDGGLDSEDDKHTNGELAFAAASYILRGRSIKQVPMYWPWCDQKWNPSTDHRISLAKACALLIAEIERLNRKEKASVEVLSRAGCHREFP